MNYRSVMAIGRTRPVTDPDQEVMPVWAGVLPLRQVAGPPVPDDRLDPGPAVPAHVAGWHRPARDGART
jgi:uncharacterized protein